MANSKKYENMSSSKAKRERAREMREAEKRRAINIKAIIVILCLIGIALIGYSIAREAKRRAEMTVASTDYSAMLNEDGTIADIDPEDYVKTIDADTPITLNREELEYSDESLEMDIDNLIDEHKELDTDETREVKDGDEVSIDYVGTMDGKEFDGGSAEGYALTIGSGAFIDNFEEQLIGSHPGDDVTVNVTFPDPYENNPDLAGKEASFAVKVNGIYDRPEFDDAFVQEYLSDYAKTAEEYRQYLKDTNYRDNLNYAIENYVDENTTAEKYPEDYLKHLKSLQMTINEREYDYMKGMYEAYGMNFTFKNVYEYFDVSNAEKYEEVLQESAETACRRNMAYQLIAKQAGITVSDEKYDSFLQENEVQEEEVKEYGKAYIIQQFIMRDKVVKYLADKADIR